MTKTRITIRNAMHNTECTVMANRGGCISHAVYNRTYRDLCGIKNCECNGQWKATLADGTVVSMLGDYIDGRGGGFTWRFDW